MNLSVPPRAAPAFTFVLALASRVGLAAGLVACASQPPVRPVALDPANPKADEAPAPPPSLAWQSSEPAAAIPATAGSPAEHEHEHAASPAAPAAVPATHDHAGHNHGAAPAAPEKAAPTSGHDHAGHAPPAPGGGDKPETAPAYVCPMHADVTSAQPGRCPKCGMALEPNDKSAHRGHK
jgi:hypothetical protein